MSQKAELKTAIRRTNRLAAIAYLDGECVNCGSTERLEFDHIKNDRKDEAHCIGRMLDSVWDKLKTELNKCQLLCKPCHCIKSAAERGRGNARHGEASRWRMGCRCDICRDGNKSRMKEYHRQRKLAVA
jgi:5-methylcytosine-specific restriction endonuclease McrA